MLLKLLKLLEEKLSHIKTPITLSIIGCVVNGPGEAAFTDIGVTGGATIIIYYILMAIKCKKYQLTK